MYPCIHLGTKPWIHINCLSLYIHLFHTHTRVCVCVCVSMYDYNSTFYVCMYVCMYVHMYWTDKGVSSVKCPCVCMCVNHTHCVLVLFHPSCVFIIFLNFIIHHWSYSKLQPINQTIHVCIYTLFVFVYVYTSNYLSVTKLRMSIYTQCSDSS